jgi:predicted nucleic acid-binding protein
LLGLDPGELDVLLLAREQQPDWVIIDERQARRAARALGLPVKGTVGILLAAGLTGLRSIDELIADLAKMISHGIRISPQLQSWLKEELEKA